jgi:hypothetical protein
MSTLTYVTVPATDGECSTAAAAPKRPGLFSRLVASIIASRQRKAMEEIKRHRALLPFELERAGWKINERSEDSLPFVR